MATRLRSREYIDNNRMAEAIGAQHFKKQLRLIVIKRKLKVHQYRSVGLWTHQLLAQGLQQGIVEFLHRLQVRNSLRYGMVARRLHLAQQWKKLVPDLVASVLERGIGDILNML